MPEGRLGRRTDTESTDVAKDSRLSQQPGHRAPSRKRPHEGGGGGGGAAKRPKSEFAQNHFSSIATLNAHSLTPQAARAADPSTQGWIMSRSHMARRSPWGFTSLSDSVWDDSAFADYSNTWWLYSAPKDLNAFRAPPLYYPSFARRQQQQQQVQLRAVREFLQRSFCTHQTSFLAPPSHWPPSGSVAGQTSAAASGR